jgi:hypothetical protein
VSCLLVGAAQRGDDRSGGARNEEGSTRRHISHMRGGCRGRCAADAAALACAIDVIECWSVTSSVDLEVVGAPPQRTANEERRTTTIEREEDRRSAVCDATPRILARRIRLLHLARTGRRSARFDRVGRRARTPAEDERTINTTQQASNKKSTW